MGDVFGPGDLCSRAATPNHTRSNQEAIETLKLEYLKMKIATKYQEFFLYRNDGKLIFQFSRGFPYNGFAARLQLGNGAGYRDGATAFLAFNSGSLDWRRAYRGGRNVNGRSEAG